MALATSSPYEYYNSVQKGNYQFITVTDIINNFIVANVGDDKIIKSTKRAEVAFHAQRAIQEMNYDTLGVIKTQEVEIPPSLSLPLPHDFINYVELVWIDASGLQHPLKESTISLEPTSILQDEDYNYLYDDNGNLLTAEESLTRSRFKGATSNDISGQDTNINFLEEGYGYNVDYGKRFGINPEYATKNGFFTINSNLGTIGFTSDLTDKLIVIKYLSDGLYSEDEMKVHKFAEEAMYKSIALGIASAKSNLPEYQINRLKKEKRASMRNAKLRLAKISPADIIQTMRIKSKQLKH